MSLLDEADTFSMMSKSDRRAALRFHETTAEDGSYDIPPDARTRLRKFGLIRHAGGKRFAETDEMVKVLPDLETWRQQNPEFDFF